MTENSLRFVQVGKFALQLLILCLVVVCPVVGDGIEPWKPVGKSVEFKLPEAEWPIVITAQVNGREMKLVINTGANITYFDGDQESVLTPLSPESQTPRPSFGKWCAAPTIKVGDFTFPSTDRVWCGDISFLEGAFGPIDGVLGMDILRQLLLHLDPDLRSVTLCTFGGPQKLPQGDRVKLDWASGLPIIHGVIAGKHGLEFFVSTGNWHSLCADADACKACIEDESLRVIGRRSRLVNTDQAIEVFAFRCSQLTIGKHSQRDLFCTHGSKNQLGYGYLARFKTTLSFPTNEIIFSPSRYYDFEDHCDGDGIELRTNAVGRLIVNAVEKGSVGESAGFRVGDVIDSVDGTDVSATHPSKIKYLLFLPRKSDAQVGVHRGYVPRTVILPRSVAR